MSYFKKIHFIFINYIMNEQGCRKWRNDKTVNPLTNRKIGRDLQLFNTFKSICEKERYVCKNFAQNPEVNPLTGRILGDNSQIKKMITYLCTNSSEIKEAKHNASKGKERTIENPLLCGTPLQCTEYPTVTLKKHQREVCEFIDHHNTKGLVLFHSVGSGKTITSITIIRCLLQKNPKQKIIVITPTSLVDNYLKEMDKLGVDFGDNVIIDSHGKFIRKIAKEGPKFCKDAIIIIDEAHNFKTKVKGVDGKRVKQLFRATKVSKQVFLLTATPVQNRASEFANLYAMITKKEDEISNLYDVFENDPPSKLKQLLKNKISYFKNTSTEDYPDVTYNTVDFYMTKDYYELYSNVEQNQLRTGFFANTKDLTVFLNGVRRAVNSVDSSVTTPKIEWTIKHIKASVRSGKKVLVYSNWLAAGIELVQKRLNDLEIDWVEVNGKMTAAKRKRAVNRYNRDECHVIFVSSAGAEGLDLKGTRSVILLEPHWNNEKLKQVIGRAVRYRSHADLPPSKRHVNIYQLVLKKPKKHSDGLESADQMLLEFAEEKEKKITEFYNILIGSSI